MIRPYTLVRFKVALLCSAFESGSICVEGLVAKALVSNAQLSCDCFFLECVVRLRPLWRTL